YTYWERRLSMIKKARVRMYRFEQIWVKNEECKKIVRYFWGEGITGHDMEGIQGKFEKLGKVLIKWNWRTFGHIQHKIRGIKKELAVLEANTPTSSSMGLEEQLNKELEDLMDKDRAVKPARPDGRPGGLTRNWPDPNRPDPNPARPEPEPDICMGRAGPSIHGPKPDPNPTRKARPERGPRPARSNG
ncbi:hypothetical protein U1Q18_029115, partial [Sarracenia purpurea var. burkii]